MCWYGGIGRDLELVSGKEEFPDGCSRNGDFADDLPAVIWGHSWLRWG
jgi:hypothetical protein